MMVHSKKWSERRHLLRVLPGMGDESERFRLRAKQCRELAAIAKDEYSRRTLTQMASELEDEASLMDAEEAAQSEELKLGRSPVRE
jgi:hypothetical protein